MLKTILISLTACLLTAACTTKSHEYRSDDGQIVATCQYSDNDSTEAVWHFTDANGNPLVSHYDSLRIVERGAEGHPMTVCFHIGDKQLWMQFYSTMQLRSRSGRVSTTSSEMYRESVRG